APGGPASGAYDAEASAAGSARLTPSATASTRLPNGLAFTPFLLEQKEAHLSTGKDTHAPRLLRPSHADFATARNRPGAGFVKSAVRRVTWCQQLEEGTPMTRLTRRTFLKRT